MHIYLSNHYKRALRVFVKNNKKNANLLSKTLILLTNNFRHPSLHLEKLQGGGWYSVRIDQSNRLFFRLLSGSIVILADIGKHDKYRQY